MNEQRRRARARRPFTLTALLALAAPLLHCESTGCDDVVEPAPRIARVHDGRLKDADGRELQLRGINARIDGVFDVTFDDGRAPVEPIPAFSRDDARAMVEAGFNFLRLPINWSGVEPEEGSFSEEYLRRVDSVIDHCRDVGLYVLVDFHQDAYSKHIGEDGAPLWAIVPPPTRLLEGPLTVEELDDRRSSSQVLEAFASFFTNTEGLQDRFLPAWRLVAQRYSEREEVIGFELMNEPVSIVVDLTMEPLYAFYDKAAPAFREVNPHHTLWLEPDAARNFSLTAPLRDEPFLDDNVVYSPHLYPFLAGKTGEDVAQWKEQLSETFDRMVEEAASWGAALVIGEWGADPRQAASHVYAQAFLELAEERLAGHALWLWKEQNQGSWGLFDRDEENGTWTPREEAFRGFIVPYVQAAPGRLLSHRFEQSTRVLEARFAAEGDESAGPLLFLSPRWYPEGARVLLDGEEAEVVLDQSGVRALVPWTARAGTFELRVEPR